MAMGSIRPRSPADFSDKAATILATEHWSLLATRSMGWNEAFSRTGVFLNVLSASVVALALVADATEFGDAFGLFALVLFPLVLFLGLATFARLVQINAEDVLQIVAMNRLRHAYVEMAPELEPYFSTGTTDDVEGTWQSLTLGAPHPSPLVQFFITTPTVVATIDAIIAAAGVALLAQRWGLATSAVILLALATMVGLWLVLFMMQVRLYLRLKTMAAAARFPAPSEDAAAQQPS